jgi:hypothetical protein
LAKTLPVLAVFYNDGAVGVAIFDPLDGEDGRAALIAIRKFGDNGLTRLAADTILAVGLRFWFPGQRFNSGGEIAAINMLDKGDDVAGRFALAAVENLLCDVDAKAVIAAASRAWSNKLLACPTQI